MEIVTGIEESFNQDEAEKFGAFEENALSEEDALEVEKSEDENNE